MIWVSQKSGMDLLFENLSSFSFLFFSYFIKILDEEPIGDISIGSALTDI